MQLKQIFILVWAAQAALPLYASEIVGAKYQSQGGEVFFFGIMANGSAQVMYNMPANSFSGGFKYLGNGMVQYIFNQGGSGMSAGFYDLQTQQSAQGIFPVAAVDVNRRLVALNGGFGDSAITVQAIFGNCKYSQNDLLGTNESYTIEQTKMFFTPSGDLNVPFKSNDGTLWKTFPVDYSQFIQACHCTPVSC